MESQYRKVISLVARGTNSGKTYLMEHLIFELKRRGKKVAAVKHAMHQHFVDPEGKDTFRFAQSGADRVILFSPHGLLMYESMHPQTDHLESIASHDVDIVLVEGFKSGPFRKIEVFNEELYTTPLCIEQPKDEYIALVSRRHMDVPLPHFCFEDVKAIARFVEENTCII